VAIAPIQFFAPAGALATVAPTAAAAATGANQATLVSFSTVLGQVLAQLGPLAFDTTLSSLGSGNNNAGGTSGGLTNTVFNLLLFNALGLGPSATQPAAQQLLVTQLLLSATGNTTDTLGLGAVAQEQFDAALAQQGTANNLLLQTANASTQPNPILFSTAALAQAFQIGNGTGSPA
jgi:hypothetical protein